MGVDNIGKVLAKKKLIEEAGLSEEEAEALASVIFEKEKKDDSMEELGKLAQAGEILQSIPPELRPAMMPVVQQSVLSPGQDDDFLKELQKTMMGLEVIRSYMNTNKGSEEDKKLIEVLLDELREMKEKALEAEMQKKDAVLEQLAQRFEENQKMIQEFMMRVLEGQGEKSEGEKKDITERIVEDLQQVNKMKELLKQLGMIKEGGGEQIDKEKVIEMLRKEGYRIEGPPSWEVVERKLQEMMKKKEEEIRKEVEEELGVKKEKARMAFDFILSLVEGAMSSLNTRGGGGGDLGGVVEKLKAALTGGEEGGGGEETEQA